MRTPLFRPLRPLATNRVSAVCARAAPPRLRERATLSRLGHRRISAAVLRRNNAPNCGAWPRIRFAQRRPRTVCRVRHARPAVVRARAAGRPRRWERRSYDSAVASVVTGSIPARLRRQSNAPNGGSRARARSAIPLRRLYRGRPAAGATRSRTLSTRRSPLPRRLLRGGANWPYATTSAATERI
jgi:hypothetical protein